MVEKKTFIAELEVKELVETTFMVKYIAVRSSRDGKEYLNLVLVDKTGEIEARKWQGANEVAEQVKIGDVCFVKGKVNQFQNRIQIIVQEINKCDKSDISMEDFVKKSSTAPEKMFDELIALVQEVPDIYIRELLLNILHDPEINQRIKVWPAGKSIHHAYEGGLLEHILSCSNLGASLSKHYNANLSYVVAGCILHDLCKIYELSSGPVVEYTDEGRLVGHLVRALELIDHFSLSQKSFPRKTKQHLKHILLSHHGELEYGSPKVPSTKEAYLVHLIDNMDSKMNALDTAIEKDNMKGNWTGMVKHLDRAIFKEDLPVHQTHIQLDSQNPSKQQPAKKDPKLTHNMSKLLSDIKIKE
jgi:3'-5' exoribonuclease